MEKTSGGEEPLIAVPTPVRADSNLYIYHPPAKPESGAYASASDEKAVFYSYIAADATTTAATSATPTPQLAVTRTPQFLSEEMRTASTSSSSGGGGGGDAAEGGSSAAGAEGGDADDKTAEGDEALDSAPRVDSRHHKTRSDAKAPPAAAAPASSVAAETAPATTGLAVPPPMVLPTSFDDAKARVDGAVAAAIARIPQNPITPPARYTPAPATERTPHPPAPQPAPSAADDDLSALPYYAQFQSLFTRISQCASSVDTDFNGSATPAPAPTAHAAATATPTASSGGGSAVAPLTPIAQLRIRLRHTYEAFLSSARRYAATIVMELHLPNHQKTIPAVDIGGVAGGTKFIVGGFLFKVATDPLISRQPPLWLYGGSAPDISLAAKAASRELNAANRYLRYFVQHQIPIHVPVQVLVDVFGFRLVAMTLLPIGRDTTSDAAGSQRTRIIYGSSDGGQTVHSGLVPFFDAAMRKAAEHLHLAEHRVRQRVLAAAGDIEGHESVDAPLTFSTASVSVPVPPSPPKQYYLLDLARTFPPESPSDTPHLPFSDRAVFARQLRPELLQYLKEQGLAPLSSDALTRWGREGGEAHDMAVRSVTRMVCTERVRTLANHLNDLRNAELPPLSRMKQALSVLIKRYPKSAAVSSAHLASLDTNLHANELMDTGPILWRRALDMCALPSSSTTPIFMKLRTKLYNPFMCSVSRVGVPDMSTLFHERGVSMRHAALVAAAVGNGDLRERLIVEMVQRSVKNILRNRLREASVQAAAERERREAAAAAAIAAAATSTPTPAGMKYKPTLGRMLSNSHPLSYAAYGSTVAEAATAAVPSAAELYDAPISDSIPAVAEAAAVVTSGSNYAAASYLATESDSKSLPPRTPAPAATSAAASVASAAAPPAIVDFKSDALPAPRDGEPAIARQNSDLDAGELRRSESIPGIEHSESNAELSALLRAADPSASATPGSAGGSSGGGLGAGAAANNGFVTSFLMGETHTAPHLNAVTVDLFNAVLNPFVVPPFAGSKSEPKTFGVVNRLWCSDIPRDLRSRFGDRAALLYLSAVEAQRIPLDRTALYPRTEKERRAVTRHERNVAAAAAVGQTVKVVTRAGERPPTPPPPPPPLPAQQPNSADPPPLPRAFTHAELAVKDAAAVIGADDLSMLSAATAATSATATVQSPLSISTQPQTPIAGSGVAVTSPISASSAAATPKLTKGEKNRKKREKVKDKSSKSKADRDASPAPDDAATARAAGTLTNATDEVAVAAAASGDTNAPAPNVSVTTPGRAARDFSRNRLPLGDLNRRLLATNFFERWCGDISTYVKSCVCVKVELERTASATEVEPTNDATAATSAAAKRVAPLNAPRRAVSLAADSLRFFCRVKGMTHVHLLAAQSWLDEGLVADNVRSLATHIYFAKRALDNILHTDPLDRDAQLYHRLASQATSLTNHVSDEDTYKSVLEYWQQQNTAASGQSTNEMRITTDTPRAIQPVATAAPPAAEEKKSLAPTSNTTAAAAGDDSIWSRAGLLVRLAVRLQPAALLCRICADYTANPLLCGSILSQAEDKLVRAEAPRLVQALKSAAANGHLEIVKSFLKRMPNLNVFTSRT